MLLPGSWINVRFRDYAVRPWWPLAENLFNVAPMYEDEHHKEVYAHFGLAVYLAQVLENGLINALMFLDFFENHTKQVWSHADWSEKFDAFTDAHVALTMGNLIRRLNKITTVPEELQVQLQTALDRRSFLVHHYFRDNVVLFTTAAGREALIDDLKQYGADFQNAAQALDALIEPIGVKYGMTADRLAASLEAWKNEIAVTGNGIPIGPTPKEPPKKAP